MSHDEIQGAPVDTAPQDFRYVENDLLPWPAFSYDALEISDDWTITLRIRYEDGTLESIAATIDNDGDGDLVPAQFHFVLVTPMPKGIHSVEIRMLNEDDVPQTVPDEVPMRFVVRSQV